jgi:hypothetical protein
MYISPLASILKVFKERGKKEVGKKRSISTFMDFKSIIAMHWPFFDASKVAFKACLKCLNFHVQIKPCILFIGDLKEETIFE